MKAHSDKVCLKPYKGTVLQELQEAECVITVWFCEAVCSGEVDPMLTYFTDAE
jgi:hypothetical protein